MKKCNINFIQSYLKNALNNSWVTLTTEFNSQKNCVFMAFNSYSNK